MAKVAQNVIVSPRSEKDQAKDCVAKAKRMVQKSPALRKRIRTLTYDIFSEF